MSNFLYLLDLFDGFFLYHGFKNSAKTIFNLNSVLINVCRKMIFIYRLVLIELIKKEFDNT